MVVVMTLIGAGAAVVSTAMFLGCLGMFWLAAQAAAANQILDPEIPLDEELNVTYVKRGDRELKLDIYSPRGVSKPTPVVVCIHGGGWKAGKKEDFAVFARYYAQQGFIAVSVQYRLTPGARYPSQINDVKCAIRWLRANAEKYHIDPTRLAVAGGSAGGHLALLAGLMDDKTAVPAGAPHADQSSKAQAVVNYFGPADFTTTNWLPVVDDMLVALMNGKRDKLPKEYAAASPISYIDKADPPVMTFHGTRDPLVPYKQATSLHAALKKAGVENHLETIEGQGHGFKPADTLRTLKMSSTFLQKHLR